MAAGQVVVITGASGGIGAALAKCYAQPGVTLGLIARDARRLEPLAEHCRRQGSEVITKAVDVRNREELQQWLCEFDDWRTIDCLIANAGVTCGLGENRGPETNEEAERLADVNYKGVVNSVSALVTRMQQRGNGKLVLVSSLAAWGPLADMPSYSATKAAIHAYGHSLRRWLKPFGIKVTILCPGFVTSPMSARHHGARPFEISAEKAAGKMKKAITRGRRVFAFPLPLALGLYLCRLLPPAISDWFMKPFRARIEKDNRYP